MYNIDSASNIAKAVEQVLEWPYLPCFGHTINVAVKDGLVIPRMQKVISKCSNIVAYFRRSSKAMYIFKEKQIALGLPQHSLTQDLETRWNSTYKMMERVCEQPALICAALVDVKIIQMLQPFFSLQKVLVGKAVVHYHQSGLFFLACLMML